MNNKVVSLGNGLFMVMGRDLTNEMKRSTDFAEIFEDRVYLYNELGNSLSVTSYTSMVALRAVINSVRAR